MLFTNVGITLPSSSFRTNTQRYSCSPTGEGLRHLRIQMLPSSLKQRLKPMPVIVKTLYNLENASKEEPDQLSANTIVQLSVFLADPTQENFMYVITTLLSVYVDNLARLKI